MKKIWRRRRNENIISAWLMQLANTETAAKLAAYITSILKQTHSTMAGCRSSCLRETNIHGDSAHLPWRSPLNIGGVSGYYLATIAACGGGSGSAWLM